MSRKNYNRQRRFQYWSDIPKDAEEQKARFRALDIQPGRCYALCKQADIINALVLVEKKGPRNPNYPNEEDWYTAKVITKEGNGTFSRNSASLGWQVIREFKHIVEFDVKRFLTLDKQLAMINVQLNAYQGIITKSIKEGHYK